MIRGGEALSRYVMELRVEILGNLSICARHGNLLMHSLIAPKTPFLSFFSSSKLLDYTVISSDARQCCVSAIWTRDCWLVNEELLVEKEKAKKLAKWLLGTEKSYDAIAPDLEDLSPKANFVMGTQDVCG